MLMNVYEDINDELRNQTIQVGNYFKKILRRLGPQRVLKSTVRFGIK